MLLLMSLLLAPIQTPPPPRRLVAVKPGPRRYFQDNGKPGCPSAKPACLRKAYVIAGDLLLAGEQRGAFTAVTFLGRNGGAPTEGWLESNALRPVSAAPVWAGYWTGWDARIEIKRGKRPGRFAVDGNATWGTHDAWRVKNGGIHVGELAGDIAPQGDRATYSDGDAESCRVELRVIGPYLLAEDNNRCGGLNVSFSGIYRR